MKERKKNAVNIGRKWSEMGQNGQWKLGRIDSARARTPDSFESFSKQDLYVIITGGGREEKE